MRGFSRQAYEKGVVIVRCPSCDARHLVADRLGWFGDRGSVEDFLKGRGRGAPPCSHLPSFTPSRKTLIPWCYSS